MAEPHTVGAIVSLSDRTGITGIFHRAADGMWIDEDGFEHTWADIAVLAVGQHLDVDQS